MTEPNSVEDGVVVSLAYSLSLDDGDVIDEASADDPLSYLHGAGNIIPGLESALTGMKIGESKTVDVEATEAYGEYDDEAFQHVPYEAFPEDMEPEEGQMVHLTDEQGGGHVQATITELGDDSVTLDLNHPLAGETLHFDVEVVGLRNATAEEVAHGHVHDGHAHH